MLRRQNRCGGTNLISRAGESFSLYSSDLLAYSALDETDGTLPIVRHVDAAQPLIDACTPSSRDLHRPRVENTRLRMPSCCLTTLQNDSSDTEAGELECCGEAALAASYDDYASRRLWFRHTRSSPEHFAVSATLRSRSP